MGLEAGQKKGLARGHASATVPGCPLAKSELGGGMKDLVWPGCRMDHGPWITNAVYWKRPQFRGLMHDLDRGDCLIAWRLDRIDRNPFRLGKALRGLVSRQVRIYVLDFDRMPLDIHGPGGKVFVKLTSTVADMFRSQRRDGVKRALDRGNRR
jgi:hypothetical protein